MKYVSCELLEHGLCFMNKYIFTCCYSPADRRNKIEEEILLQEIGDDDKIDVEKLILQTKKLRENAKKGILPHSCNNCYQLKEKEWEDKDYYSNIYVTHFEKCNADCIYCTSYGGIHTNTDKEPYKVMPVLRELDKRGLLKDEIEIHIGGGEPTLYDELDDIVKEYCLTGRAKMFAVPTSGIKYSEMLAEGMKLDFHTSFVLLIISIDSGSPEVYKKIKKVDEFYTVVENIRKYAQICDYKMQVKYIVIPHFNDTIEEFTRFLDMCQSIGVTKLGLDIDANYARKFDFKVDVKLINLINDMVVMSKDRGFDTELFMFFRHVLSYYNKDKEIEVNQ